MHTNPICSCLLAVLVLVPALGAASEADSSKEQLVADKAQVAIDAAAADTTAGAKGGDAHQHDANRGCCQMHAQKKGKEMGCKMMAEGKKEMGCKMMAEGEKKTGCKMMAQGKQDTGCKMMQKQQRMQKQKQEGQHEHGAAEQT